MEQPVDDLEFDLLSELDRVRQTDITALEDMFDVQAPSYGLTFFGEVVSDDGVGTEDCERFLADLAEEDVTAEFKKEVS